MSYSDRKIGNDIMAELITMLRDVESIATSAFQLKYIGGSGTKGNERVGTYGMISGATDYIAVIARREGNDPVEIGRLFETAVLQLADLGLDTCWLGGSFNRNDFEGRLDLGSSEYIPIVSPVGYGKERFSILDSSVRAMVGADTRKPWNEMFFNENALNPLEKDKAGAFRIPLEMVRLGPSASNKQPWRVITDSKGCHFYLSRDKGYGLKTYDLQLNDIGIAMCHFELTASQWGMAGSWKSEAHPAAPSEWEYVRSYII
jgi:hypothetical protein